MNKLFKLLLIVVLLTIAVTTRSEHAEAQAAISITQARAAADGTAVIVQGTVNSTPGNFDTKLSRFYVQDTAAGIAIYYGAGGLPVFVPGDTVKVSGKLNTYKGERELEPAALSDVTKLSSGTPPAPIAIKSGTLGANNQGLLVTFGGKVTATRNGFSINDGSGDGHVFINTATGIKAAVTLGQQVTVIGIASIYNTGYEVLPRQPSDVVVAGVAGTNATAQAGGSQPITNNGTRERGSEPPKRTLDTDTHDTQIEIADVYATTDEASVNEQAEAIRLYNSGSVPLDLNGWTLTDDKNTVKLDGITLTAHQRVWIAKNATRFKAEFGTPPDAEYGACEKTIPCLGGTPLMLDNQGDQVVLLSPAGSVVDTLVYGDGYTSETGWTGTALQPYLFASYVPAAGQIFYRKLDPATCLPLASAAKNTHSAADWAQDPNDPAAGRHMLYPGWNLDQFCAPAKGTDNATTTFLVAPDNSFAGLVAALDKAQSEIDLELYFITSPAIVDHLTAAQARGVKVRMLFDGDLSGGDPLKLSHATVISYAQNFWAAQTITAHGGDVAFWAANTAVTPPIPHRYNNDHQKFVIIDHKTAVISSENFAQSAFPNTGSAANTAGNRGAIVVTDAPTVVKRLDAIFAADDDSTRSDIQVWESVAQQYARPADGTAQGYKPIQPEPLIISGPTEFEVVQSPETSADTNDSLIGMVAKAGKGDRVLVEQQYEYLDWGASPSYMNPRLQAYIDAARRGANVQIILDGVNSEATNAPTVAALKKIAATQGITIEARITPKTGTSGNAFHIKMVIITSGADGYVHIGSLNGSENSSRYNREVAVQVKSRAAFDYYAKVFDYDWSVSPKR